MTRDEIRAALARCEAATPGPWNESDWRFDSIEEMAAELETALSNAPDGGSRLRLHACWVYQGGEYLFPAITGNGPTSGANNTFISSARTDLPRALAALVRVLALADEYEARAGRCDDHTYGAREIASAIRRAVEGE